MPYRPQGSSPRCERCRSLKEYDSYVMDLLHNELRTSRDRLRSVEEDLKRVDSRSEEITRQNAKLRAELERLRRKVTKRPSNMSTSSLSSCSRLSLASPAHCDRPFDRSSTITMSHSQMERYEITPTSTLDSLSVSSGSNTSVLDGECEDQASVESENADRVDDDDVEYDSGDDYFPTLFNDNDAVQPEREKDSSSCHSNTVSSAQSDPFALEPGALDEIYRQLRPGVIQGKTQASAASPIPTTTPEQQQGADAVRVSGSASTSMGAVVLPLGQSVPSLPATQTEVHERADSSRPVDRSGSRGITSESNEPEVRVGIIDWDNPAMEFNGGPIGLLQTRAMWPTTDVRCDREDTETAVPPVVNSNGADRYLMPIYRPTVTSARTMQAGGEEEENAGSSRDVTEAAEGPPSKRLRYEETQQLQPRPQPVGEDADSAGAEPEQHIGCMPVVYDDEAKFSPLIPRDILERGSSMVIEEDPEVQVLEPEDETTWDAIVGWF